jgi:hypothetical protein
MSLYHCVKAIMATARYTSSYHSIETALLSVHDHSFRAMSLQQITCLCLFDLPATFDTIDNYFLIHRLTSWFGIYIWLCSVLVQILTIKYIDHSMSI